MSDRKARLIAGLGAVAVVLIHSFLIRHYYFLCDDAFISFRYVANWLAGHGLTYNPGERVEGYTNLGWVLLLAPFARMGVPPEDAAAPLSIGFSFALLVLVFLAPAIIGGEGALSRLHAGRGRAGAALLAPLLLAANRSYNIWATGGLETRMFSLLVFAGLIAAARGLHRPPLRPWLLAGLLFGLAELTRPEALLLGATAFPLAAAARRWQRRPVPWPALAGGTAVFLLLVGGHFGWRRVYYGTWLPNTYYAKAGRTWFSAGVPYLALFGFEYFMYLWMVPIGRLLIQSLRGRDPFPLGLAGFVAPYLVYLAAVGGDHFEYRFLDPLLAPAALLMVMAAVGAVEAASGSRLRQGLIGGALALVAVCHLGFPALTELQPPVQYTELRDRAEAETGPWLRRLPGLPSALGLYNRFYGRQVPHLVGVRWEDHRYLSRGLMSEARQLRSLLDRGYLERSDRLCIQTAGIVPYFTGMWALDYFGLTNPTVAHQPTPRSDKLFHDRRAGPELIRSLAIDYIYLEVSACPDPQAWQAEPPSIPLNPYEIEMLHGLDGRLYLACADRIAFLFFSPQPPAEFRARLEKRGWLLISYRRGEDGIFRPGP